MAKRIKKPPVQLEKRWEWLRRRENNESVPQIAKSDGYDVRTVRRHIEIAKQEMEVKDARSSVLRNALERHYADLCNYAERLDARITANHDITASSADDNLMEMALRQHLPRSPIWNYLAKRQNLQQESVRQLGEVKRRVEITTRSKRILGPLISAGLSGVVPGIIDALTSQANRWSHDRPALNIKNDLVATPAGEGLVEIHYGDFRMCIVDSQDAERYLKTIRQVIKGLENSIVKWEIYDDLKKTNTEIDRLDRKLHEELAVIRLRRIVPGRCRFCPL